MSKLLIFMQAKGKWHKFPSFNLGGGAKLYKNFAQKLLAVSLCAAVVLCTVPLRGGSHVSEAAEGSLLSLVGSGDHPYAVGPATITATFVAFDLSSFPAFHSYTPAAFEFFVLAACPFGNPSTGGACSLAFSLDELSVCSHVGSCPCVGCWAGSSPLGLRAVPS